ncbi:MAG: hypothetical protein LN411_03975 [Candidatus Thermoplasmatota archaeon]|nr:hypothetical protein [Candidatus Thermoplasmatota archaeon]
MELVGGKKGRALIVAAVLVAASTVTVAWVLDRSERGVVLTVDTDKEEYAPGDSVTMYAQLKNYGSRTVTLVYPSSVVVQFSIYDSAGSCVFVGPTAGLAVITDVVLEPGGTYNCEWGCDQINLTSDQVELPDSFTVRAVSYCYEHSFSANTAISISD